MWDLFGNHIVGFPTRRLICNLGLLEHHFILAGNKVHVSKVRVVYGLFYFSIVRRIYCVFL